MDVLKWIPVIGTLSGAIIGFGAAFLTAWFNQRRAEQVARNNRRRDRLEEVYRTLVKIKIDSQDLSGKLLKHIHYDTQIEMEDVPDFPPIINLQMLVDLYFTELHLEYKNYVDAKNDLGKKFASLLSKKFNNSTLEVKQQHADEVLKLQRNVESRISLFQQKLAILSRDIA